MTPENATQKHDKEKTALDFLFRQRVMLVV